MVYDDVLVGHGPAGIKDSPRGGQNILVSSIKCRISMEMVWVDLKNICCRSTSDIAFTSLAETLGKCLLKAALASAMARVLAGLNCPVLARLSAISGVKSGMTTRLLR